MTKASVAEIEVGSRLRARRERDGLTLRELARRLGVSPSAISQVETGKSLPSVSRLYAIVTELGMSLDELFGHDASKSARPPTTLGASPPQQRTQQRAAVEPEAGHVQRAGMRKGLELESGVLWERLTANAESMADFLYVVYEVGGSSSQGDQFMRHLGREYGLVLSGTLEVTVGFDSYLLGPGDSISFDSTVPHRLRNIGSEQVTGVWFVIGRQGDALVRSESGGS